MENDLVVVSRVTENITLGVSGNPNTSFALSAPELQQTIQTFLANSAAMSLTGLGILIARATHRSPIVPSAR